MAGLTGVCLLALAGAVFAGIMAGRAEKRAVLYWNGGALLWALFCCGGLFCMKDAFRKLIFQNLPHLEHLALDLAVHFVMDRVVLHFALLLFPAAVSLYLLSFNCRKNSSRWYWSLLWSVGLALLAGYVLFLPLYCGAGTWMSFSGLTEGDLFDSSRFVLPLLYTLGVVFPAALLLWLRHTLKTAKHSWKNILFFAGSFTAFVCILFLSAWCVGAWGESQMKSEAAKRGIFPMQVASGRPAEWQGIQEELHRFYRRYPLYQPPCSGKYHWFGESVPEAERDFTLKFFTSPELAKHLENLRKCASLAGKKDVLYLSSMNDFRSLVRHQAGRAQLFSIAGMEEKILPELLMYPDMEAMIPGDTPFLICELVRTAVRYTWCTQVIQFAPEDADSLKVYRKLLAWSNTWRVHLPCEAGMYLAEPPAMANRVAAFFYTPYQRAARYRGFRNAVDRLPALQKMEMQEVITGSDIFANAARRQRLGLVMVRTALALKVYRVEHGKYPASLAELVPRYLPREYVSPSTGKKLSYTVEERAACQTENINGTRLFRMEAEQDFTLSSDQMTITSNKRGGGQK